MIPSAACAINDREEILCDAHRSGPRHPARNPARRRLFEEGRATLPVVALAVGMLIGGTVNTIVTKVSDAHLSVTSLLDLPLNLLVCQVVCETYNITSMPTVHRLLWNPDR